MIRASCSASGGVWGYRRVQFDLSAKSAAAQANCRADRSQPLFSASWGAWHCGAAV